MRQEEQVISTLEERKRERVCDPPGDTFGERHERQEQQVAPGNRKLVGHYAVAVRLKQVEQREPDASPTLELLVVVLYEQNIKTRGFSS